MLEPREVIQTQLEMRGSENNTHLRLPYLGGFGICGYPEKQAISCGYAGRRGSEIGPSGIVVAMLARCWQAPYIGYDEPIVELSTRRCHNQLLGHESADITTAYVLWTYIYHRQHGPSAGLAA